MRPSTQSYRVLAAGLKTSVKAITQVSDTNCLEIHGTSLNCNAC
ncbi:nitrite extrusion protein 2 [Salmonella enterica subsp. enterica]|nr:nitrite extrusion protein 2 [Salmonella enterica subsp. enterica serovar 4,[5],12:i:-]EBJ7616365.1 nitrite extrusion protein 2 [Salmonella enterica]EFO4014924.1 nitrite extrusion protein 2 [Escherichia coli]KDV63143.1 nitrite extrusion protein 2 domain protein [Escherichia coli O128:H2 str. 2011C-3317]EBM3985691.1 nitrite extrusion protein 2 [Salmonella enterica]